ncbi:histidine kinase [Pseudoduganella sp. DS3]|uniref:histidine kinase n=1 Tax=Pseudoduganella guangdongensis TaxID=2692179 RepID=A0A6N9HMD8_9BURK|nr:sensor histidine kinase [Pseudoduganella guangdongensis]MYN04724.1 histidine kinase [Pseudoduganella guangdongensis]
MYSLIPAVVSALFIGYGLYVLRSRGPSRVGLSFFAVCATTFFWQASWSLLFMTHDDATALALARLGYLPILFLPTTLYHFIIELTGSQDDRPGLYLSYGLACLLGLLLPTTEAVLSGLQHYFYGSYPKAGWLHPLHLVQTVLVIGRAVWLLYRRQQRAVSTERTRLRYVLVSILIYFGAASDYLCNYGVEMYPPGVAFILASLGLIAQAMVRHNLLADPMAAAATIAHEMRTPLASIRSQTRMLSRCLPELIAGYRPEHKGALGARQLQHLGDIARSIDAEVSRSNFIVDMLLASARDGVMQRETFAVHSVAVCVDEAMACYPFTGAERAQVRVTISNEYSFYGSDVLLMFVLYNLLKNALQALQLNGRGTVDVECYSRGMQNWLVVTDTGHGIEPDVLPHVFEPFYTTRRNGCGTGMGLAFCKRVVSAFGGEIACESEPGRYTRILISLPRTTASPRDPARKHIAEHYPVAQ